MKRIGLFLLAVVMLVGIAGCGGDNDANPVGTWAASWDDGCNGTNGGNQLHIHKNGTLIDSFGATGVWSVDGDTITINYASGAIWSGDIVNGNAISGTYTNATGGPGCWSATKLRDTP